MDDIRQIRVTVPPFFLIGALLLAAWFDADKSNWLREFLMGAFGTTTQPAAQQSGGASAIEVIGILAAGGAIVIALGHLIGALTITLLRAFALTARKFGCYTYEACISNDGLRNICKILEIDYVDKTSQKQTLYLVATFDHFKLKHDAAGVHEWIARRWSAFNSSASSALMVVLVLVAGRFIQINPNPVCKSILAAVIAVLLLHAVTSWRQTMKMIEFQAARLRAKEGRK